MRSPGRWETGMHKRYITSMGMELKEDDVFRKQ